MLPVSAVSILLSFDLTSQQTTVTPRPPGLKTATSSPQYVPLYPYLFFVHFYMHVWMDDCILAEKNCYVNLNSTQTTLSPVQVTQPSSTQDSFAKSNGPALLLSSLCFSLLFRCPSPANPHQARPPTLFSLPPRRKDGRWCFVCQRLCRWMGNSHWIIWVGRMLQHL